MIIEKLTEKLNEAQKAVENLEEPLKTEAFKKILDKLLEPDRPIAPEQTNTFSHEGDNNKGIPKKKNDYKKRKPNRSNARVREEAEKYKRSLAEKINRTEHQKIHDLKTTLARVLYVIKIMKEKEVDGLTPPEIEYILREVFKIKISKQLISVSLNRNEGPKCADRTRKVLGKSVAYKYKLVKIGEDFLERKLKKLNNHEDKPDEGKEPALPK